MAFTPPPVDSLEPEDKFQPPPLDSIEPNGPSAGEYIDRTLTSFGNSIARGFGETLKSAGYASRFLDPLGEPASQLLHKINPAEAPEGLHPLEQFAYSINKQAAQDEKHLDPRTKGSIGDVVGGTAGSLLEFMGEAAVGGAEAKAALGLSKAAAGRLAAAGIFGLHNAATGVEHAEQAGATQDQIAESFLTNFAAGAATSTVTPLNKWVERLNEATGGGFINTLKKAAVEAPQWALQMAAQTLANDASNKFILGENPDIVRDMVKSAKDGGITGLVASTVLSSLVHGRGAFVRPDTGEPPVPPIVKETAATAGPQTAEALAKVIQSQPEPPVVPPQVVEAAKAKAAVDQPTPPAAQTRERPYLTGPGLVDETGKLIAQGKIGETHADLMNRALGTEAEDSVVPAFLNDQQHVFVDNNGKPVSRARAARIAVDQGQAPADTESLHSENLVEVGTHNKEEAPAAPPKEEPAPEPAAPPSGGKPPTEDEVRKAAYVAPTEEEKAQRVKDGTDVLRQQMQKTGVAPTYNEVRAAVGNEAAQGPEGVHATLQKEAEALKTPEPTEGKQTVNETHPATGIKLPNVVEEGKVRPVFTNDPEVTAAQIDLGQRVYPPENLINDNKINPAIKLDYDPKTESDYVSAVEHPKYGTIDRPGQLTDAYNADPERQVRSEAQTKGKTFQLTQESKARQEELASLSPAGGDAKAEAKLVDSYTREIESRISRDMPALQDLNGDPARLLSAVQEQIRYFLRRHTGENGELRRKPPVFSIYTNIRNDYYRGLAREAGEGSIDVAPEEGGGAGAKVDQQSAEEYARQQRADPIEEALLDHDIDRGLVHFDDPEEEGGVQNRGTRTTGPVTREGAERNVNEAIRLGIIRPGATIRSMLENISENRGVPGARRVLARLILKSGVDLDKIQYRLIDNPNGEYSGKYIPKGDGSEGMIRLNLGVEHNTGLSGTLLHEVFHHLTLVKLHPDYIRNAVEQKAYEALIKLHDYVSRNAMRDLFGIENPTPEDVAEFQKAQLEGKSEKYQQYRAYYGLGRLSEFVTEILQNPALQRYADGLPELAGVEKAGGKFRSVLYEVKNYLKQLFTGKDVGKGGVLDQALDQTLKFALDEPYDPKRFPPLELPDVVAAARKPPKDYRIRIKVRNEDGSISETVFGEKGPIVNFPDEIPGTPGWRKLFGLPESTEARKGSLESQRAELEAAISGEKQYTRDDLEELALKKDPSLNVQTMTQPELRLAAGLESLPEENTGRIDGPGWLGPDTKFHNVEGGAMFGVGAHERTALVKVIANNPALKEQWSKIEKAHGGAPSYDVINKFMEKNGFVRVADVGGREIFVSGKPTPKQMQALKDAAIERGADIVQDNLGRRGDILFSSGDVLAPPANPLWPTLTIRKAKDTIVAGYNSANTIANAFGRQLANAVALDIGKSKAPGLTATPAEKALWNTYLADRKALPFVVEAAGDKHQLEIDLDRVRNSKDKRLAEYYEPVVQHAIDNYDRLKPIADKYGDRMKALLQRAKDAGLSVGEIENYVARFLERPGAEKQGAVPAGGGVSPRFFTKGRIFEKLSDAIAEGYNPKLDDIVDITQKRAEVQERLIQTKVMEDELKQILAPDGKPIISANETYDTLNGKKEQRVPAGYTTIQTGGKPLVVHNSMAPLYKALYGDSTIPQILKTYVKFAKQGTLIFDTYHIGRIVAKELAYSKGEQRFGYGKGLSLLEYSNEDLDRAVAVNDISQAQADYARANRPTADLLLRHGLNVGKVADNLFAEQQRILGKVIEGFNGWVFQKLSRGAMLQTAIENYQRNLRRFPELGEDGNARRTAKEMNEVFGNLQAESIFKSRKYQDAASALVLAPNWAESQLKAEFRGYGQIARAAGEAATGKFRLGTVAQGQLTVVLGMLAANQVINFLSTGHSTFQNKEGHWLDAFIPGGRRGFWFNPFEIGAEYAFMAERYLTQHKNLADTLIQLGQNKLSPLGRGIKDFVSSRDYAGRPYQNFGDRLRATIADILPFPIPASWAIEKDPRSPTGFRRTRTPGAGEKQLLQSAGLKVAAEYSPRAQMFALAHDYRQDKSYTDNAGEYTELRKALDNNDLSSAANEMRLLISRGKTKDQIKAGVGVTRAGTIQPELFTGRKDNEKLFKKSLNPDQLAMYKQAQQDHKDNARKAKKILREIYPEVEAQLRLNKKPLRGEAPPK